MIGYSGIFGFVLSHRNLEKILGNTTFASQGSQKLYPQVLIYDFCVDWPGAKVSSSLENNLQACFCSWKNLGCKKQKWATL